MKNFIHTKYGLPADVVYCKKCVLSNQKPNSCVEYEHSLDSKKETVHFNEDGICDACRASEDKEGTNWKVRERELKDLCDRFRRDDGRYDCIVPGSGGKDSFYQSHILKTKYGMNPLTITWAPHLYTDWGWRNFQRWIHAGFDNSLFTPNGRVHRLLTRIAVERLFHPFQAFMIGQKALAPKMSILHDIPLIFYGENEAEYGNPRLDNERATRDWSFFTSEDKSKVILGGASIKELTEDFGLNDNDLLAYLPANPADLERVKTEVHYLGYYLKWHPQGAYYYAQEHGGFQAAPERTAGTYSKYVSIDDKIDDFHYYTTYIKFGLGRATYDASQEIRNDEIDRKEAVALVRRFDGEFPERFAEEIFEYLSIPEKDYPIASTKFDQPIMDRDYFTNLTDKFRSPHLWHQENGAWVPSHIVTDIETC